MKIDIVTVFPEMVEAALDHSIVKRARDRGQVTINVVNLRDFTLDRHRTTDDIPYGGGGGMIMKIEPIAYALQKLTGVSELLEADRSGVSSMMDLQEDAVEPPFGVDTSHGIMEGPRIVLTDPRGPRFTQEIARQWAQEAHIILLCGHYEGVDERVRRYLVTDEISIGDFILTGGELPALVITDALTRLQPGALGDAEAPSKDTFAENLLEYPHYTRPRSFCGWSVPDILMSGHHAEIERWRRWQSLHATRERRPDLLGRLTLSRKDQQLLAAAEPTAPEHHRAVRNARTAVNDTLQDRLCEAVPPTELTDPTQILANHNQAADRKEEQEENDGTGTRNDT